MLLFALSVGVMSSGALLSLELRSLNLTVLARGLEEEKKRLEDLVRNLSSRP
jgi:hypothetical protein